LFELVQPRLKYYVRRLNNGGSTTEDILQDIWLSVYKRIGTLKNVQLFRVWLYRIARNRVYDGFKSKEKFTQLPQDNEIPVTGSNEPTFNADDAQQIHHALSKLKPTQKEVLTLRFIEQMSYQSIADVVGCQIGTVRSRLFHAKISLREEMERTNVH
jgi:RNA polymerase sigma-70 factor (ECF subfamily)